MKSLARHHVYWPNIDAEIENIAKSCRICQQNAPNPQSAPLHPWQFPERPWQRLHMDLAGPLHGEMWLIIVDARTNWPEVFSMNNNTTSTAVIHKLAECFARFGIPEQIVTDNGRQSTSQEFKKFCDANCVKHVLSSVYHPRSNEEAERFVRTFKKSMKATDLSVGLRLQRFLIAYRATAHATTGTTPSVLLQSRRLRTLLDPNVSTTVCNEQLEQEKQYNQRAHNGGGGVFGSK
ncbi:unnamed protein product [Orchesella dallaii]|uniref:RNA-directed DNA polymerase n=1 Tax=Orchesella dallaii TaxID=48710 RepID=A0ABP1Q3D8_9HEXA